jgi:hypothetical protein
LPKTLVWPFLMIVMDERAYGCSELGFAEWHDQQSSEPLTTQKCARRPGRQ